MKVTTGIGFTKFTANEFAAKFNLEYVQAAVFLKILEQLGAAKRLGTQPTKTGKGKPSTIFAVCNEFVIELPTDGTPADEPQAETPTDTEVAATPPEPQGETVRLVFEPELTADLATVG